MIEISIPRIKRYAMILGAAGSVAAGLAFGLKEGASFLVGSSLALVSIESWSRLAASLNPDPTAVKPSVGASGAFLLLRYVLIGGAVYATVKVLGVTPVVVLLGLFVSFAAVVVEILQQFSKK